MRSRTVAILLLLALLAAACGQRKGVHVDASGRGAGGGGDAAFDAGEGEDLGDVAGEEGAAEEGDAAEAGGGGDLAGGAAGASGGGSAARGGGGAAGGGPGAPTGAAAVGKVWGDTIVIGIHAPLTGAAPLPAASFDRGSKVYVDYINSKGGIHGREVVVEFLDDEYQPATAVSKCKQLVQQKKAFLLFGGGGTDQIQACARYAASVGVPYLSAGVTEVNMTSLRNYFAASMSYPQQAKPLARYIKGKFTGKKVGIVYSNTKNFYDARDAFEAEMGTSTRFQMGRVPSQSEIGTTARKMCDEGIDVAFVLTAPSTYIALANQVQTQCRPIQWTGVGITMGLNAVADPGCKTNKAVDKGIFFSPFPGVDKIESMDKDFKPATKGEAYDDIYVALWGGLKTVGALLENAGKDLSRAGFIKASETATVRTGVYPDITYSAGNHFGAKTFHVLQADCSIGKYRTLETFATY